MPNGSPDLDISSYEFFIAPAEESILLLVDRRRLVLQKYYHNSASWDLCFAHPNGGLAKVEIYMQSDSNARIRAIWWLDDHDEGTRSIRRSSDRFMSPNVPQFVGEVESILDDVLCWQKGVWDSVHGGYRDIWNKYPDKDIEPASRNWQIPRM